MAIIPLALHAESGPTSEVSPTPLNNPQPTYVPKPKVEGILVNLHSPHFTVTYEVTLSNGWFPYKTTCHVILIDIIFTNYGSHMPPTQNTFISTNSNRPRGLIATMSDIEIVNINSENNTWHVVVGLDSKRVDDINSHPISP